MVTASLALLPRYANPGWWGRPAFLLGLHRVVDAVHDLCVDAVHDLRVDAVHDCMLTLCTICVLTLCMIVC